MHACGDRTDRLLAKLPAIRRARFWRLYAYSGERFLDLWMDGGRSILGAKGKSVGTGIKAAIDKGLTRPLPSVWESRLQKDFRNRWPLYPYALFFRTESGAARALRDLGKTEFRILRPFGEYLDEGDSTKPPTIALSLLPCPSAFAPGLLLFADENLALEFSGELVPAVQLAALATSLGEFDTFAEQYTERLWRRFDRYIAGVFERRGPYLLPLYPREMHPEYFLACLEAGLLLSPDYDSPSIIPGDFDEGELARLPRIPTIA
jgi:hypothetical protein